VKNIVFLIIYLLNTCVYAQFAQEEKLAAQFFNEKEYSKAADIYEDLLKKQAESIYYYENLLQCYTLLNDNKAAEKLIDKRIKKYPTNYIYQIDKGNFYHQTKDFEKRDKIFKDIVNLNFSSTEVVENILNSFVKRGFLSEAIKVGLNARKQLRQPGLFIYELSEIYFRNGQKKEGIEELVSIIGENESILQEVKNKVSVQLKGDDFSILSRVIIQNIQSKPENIGLNDLLIWSFVQQKDWDGAIIQSKAIDRRLKEGGLWQLNLAFTLMNNEEYSYALKCFTDIKALGSDKRFYSQAQQGILQCGIAQIRQKNGGTQSELLILEKEFLEFINTNGVNLYSIDQMKLLAELYVYYLKDEKKGINWLNQIISMKGANPKTVAESKINLGDAYLISGDTWEADLLYKQVEKDYKNDPLGQEAKFKYARLCFYRGDFEWAQTQLDVLKEATTQLISNNAMQLWLTIQDNIGLDSTEEALTYYSKADLLIFQNKFDQALLVLDTLNKVFPNHTLTDEILFAKATIAEKQNQFKEAEVYYLKIIKDHSFDILADNALINLGKIYEFKMNDTANAKKMYEFLILNYTGSLFANEARFRYRFLRGDMKQESTENYWD